MFNDWWKGISEQLPQLREQLTEQINQTLAPWLPTLVEEVHICKHPLRILRKLGEGGYSFVYLAQEILPDAASISTTVPSPGTQLPPLARKYALKKVLAGEKEQLALAEREISAMRRLPKHPNLLPLIESQVVKEDNMYVVYMLFPLMVSIPIINLKSFRKLTEKVSAIKNRFIIFLSFFLYRKPMFGITSKTG
jgi:serine/threonine protein kinase